MFNYVKVCLSSKYATFNGRARRSEYWYFVLFYFLVVILLSMVSVSLGDIGTTLIGVFYLGVIIPYIAVTWRRMHDVGKSGWFCFIPIYNLVLACTDSQNGENEYGPNPKGIGNNGNTDDLISSIGNQQ